MPSILSHSDLDGVTSASFKPCYKWNAFNTQNMKGAQTVAPIEF